MAEDEVDKVIVDFFAALEELGELRSRYDNVVGNGYLQLAKTRYSMGAGSVSKLQYDATMTANCLVDVEQHDEEELISFVSIELDSSLKSETVDEEEVHLRRRLVGNEKQVETIGQSQSAPVAHKSVKDPLKWFGLLVPPSLRTAQKNFKEAIEISCQLASTQAKVEHYRKLYLTLIANKDSKNSLNKL